VNSLFGARRKTRFIPLVNGMEDRVLLSGGGGVPAAAQTLALDISQYMIAFKIFASQPDYSAILPACVLGWKGLQQEGETTLGTFITISVGVTNGTFKLNAFAIPGNPIVKYPFTFHCGLHGENPALQTYGQPSLFETPLNNSDIPTIEKDLSLLVPDTLKPLPPSSFVSTATKWVDYLHRMGVTDVFAFQLVKDQVIGTSPPNLYQQMDVYAWVIFRDPITDIQTPVFFPAVFVINQYGEDTHDLFLPLEPMSSPPTLQYFTSRGL
jgi:hypothetical protein